MSEASLITITATITGFVTAVLTLTATKGVDAIIRWRRSESEMTKTKQDDLRDRIIHLEGVVGSLQKENSHLMLRVGILQGHLDMLERMFAINGITLPQVSIPSDGQEPDEAADDLLGG